MFRIWILEVPKGIYVYTTMHKNPPVTPSQY